MSDGVPRRPAFADARQPWNTLRLAALDFETTGLEFGRDAVVSFGVVPVVDGRVRFHDRVYREVAPDTPLTARTIVVHGIRPTDVAGAPPIAAVRAELSAALDRRYILAWAAHVEASFLASVFGGRPSHWMRRCIDVLPLAMLADRSVGRRPGPGGYALTAAAAHFGVPVERPHHALDDALTTAQLFLVVARHLEDEGIASPRRLRTAARHADLG